MVIIKLIILIVLMVLLFFAGVAGYALFLVKKRSPLKLYEARAMESDFVPLTQIPERQVELIIAMEDGKFYSHRGFLISSIRKSMKLNLREKRIVVGGSTITQQLAKNLYFSFVQSYLRKAAEIPVVMVMERTLGKKRILELYLNIIYFGNGIYGIGDAAHFYFEKPVSDLTLNQMFILSCIIPAPTRGNPVRYPDVFERRRNSSLGDVMAITPPPITPEERMYISSFGSDRLDPELRKPDEFILNYPQTIPLLNERFGPFKQIVYHSTWSYSNSPMVTYVKLSPYHSGPRTHYIDRITPHCAIGQLSAEELGDCFASPGNKASSNYGIDRDGRVALYVDERNRSWCSSDASNDHRAVTIECASDAAEPHAFNDIVYQTLIILCADICRRNGKKKLLWLGDREMTLEYIPADDEMVLTVHRWFADKNCPGSWMYARMSDLADQVTAELIV